MGYEKDKPALQEKINAQLNENSVMGIQRAVVAQNNLISAQNDEIIRLLKEAAKLFSTKGI